MGNSAYWQLGLDGTAATADRIIDIPTGFRGVYSTSGTGYYPFNATGSAGQYLPVEAHSGGYLRWATASVAKVSLVRATATSPVTEPWPAALPGVSG
ncbi:hypothetical protein [Nocardioides jensenii]|uniref:hypothetical protein n=1 Tax=Nocardioides jensenii TaxID=1843 RepID=UPI000834B273|nr:hypothetical protein [Nocardioides jensenii]